MAALYPSTATGDYSKTYIPDLADSANILTAFKNFYYGTTNGTPDLSAGIYGALETLYYGDPVLAGTLTVDGDLIINGTTTTLNSNTLSVVDKNIDIGAVATNTDVSGTVSSITGTGPWTATLTTTENLDVIPGQSLTQVTAGTGTLYGGSPTSVLITSVISDTVFTYTVTGGTIPTAGTVTNFTIGGASNFTANGAGITVFNGATNPTWQYNYNNVTNGNPAWTANYPINSTALYIGSGTFPNYNPGSGLLSFSSASIIAKGSNSAYAQSAMINTNSAGSADFAAYGDNGDDTSGWADMGFTGSAFSDSNYTITNPNDGYLFVSARSGASKTGNLVLSTSGNGTSNAILFGTGGFLAANERMRLTSSGLLFSGATSIITAASTAAATPAISLKSGDVTTVANTGAGTVTIDTGARTGTGTNTLNLGNTNATVISLGNANTTTTALGTFKIGTSAVSAGSAFAYSLPTVTANDVIATSTSTNTFTNKTFNTTGNTFQIAGTGITAVTGTGSVVLSAAPTLTGITTIASVNVSDLYKIQATPTAKTAAVTLTIGELLTEIITGTSTTPFSLQLPTGTAADAGIQAGASPTNASFDWSLINLGSSTGAVTITVNTGHTIVGNAVVAISTTGVFRTRKTAANTFVTYRIG